jgi:hypothetical protein
MLIEGGYMHSLNALIEKSRAADKSLASRKRSLSIGHGTRAIGFTAWIMQLLKPPRWNRYGQM